jgi:hypothetical protein
MTDVATKQGDLAHQSRGNERELLLGHHENGLDLGLEVAAHVGELKFEFEIGHRAQAAHDDLQAMLARDVHRQAAVADDFDIRRIAEHAAHELDTLLYIKGRRLVGIGGYGNDDAREDASRPAGDILVTARERIEGPWIQRARSHALAPVCPDWYR